jgi:hypothetical protein
MVLDLKNSSFIDFTLVIPTLGVRKDELAQSLLTLSTSQFRCYLILVTPENQIKTISEMVNLYCPDFEAKCIVENENSNIPKAINQGLAGVQTKFWNWAGDDDRIVLDEIAKLVGKLYSNDGFALGVGSCNYFALKSKTKILNEVTQFSSKVIFWGPNLIPQPSVVFRTRVVRELGGINPKYKLAFDQDLISKCLRTGNLLVHKSVTSEYRWGRDTFTSKYRKQSLRESHQIRLQYAITFHQRIFIQLMYPIVIGMVRFSDLIFRFRFRK